MKLDTVIEWLKYIVYALFIYLNIDIDVVKILFYLMVIDTFLGVIKAFRIGVEFSAKKLLFGFISKISVLLIPMAIALIGKGLSFDFSLFVTVVIDILIVSDGISIFSNFIAIKTRQETKNIDVVTKLLKLIRDKLIKIIDSLFNTMNNV